MEPYFSSLGVGETGQTELGKKSLHEINLLIAPKFLQTKFSVKITPLRQLCLNLLVQNINFCKQRDILLPKLISGKIDVENLDIPTN